MSLVSVIIPYYRKKQYIYRTLKSVINQSYKKLEIIIIYDDDNKEDLKFIKQITLKDKRIKILVNKKNMGAGMFVYQLETKDARISKKMVLLK